MIENAAGAHELKALNGGKLWAYLQAGNLLLKAAKGRVARVTIANVLQSNGVIHVIDGVLLPNCAPGVLAGRPPAQRRPPPAAA